MGVGGWGGWDQSQACTLPTWAALPVLDVCGCPTPHFSQGAAANLSPSPGRPCPYLVPGPAPAGPGKQPRFPTSPSPGGIPVAPRSHTYLPLRHLLPSLCSPSSLCPCRVFSWSLFTPVYGIATLLNVGFEFQTEHSTRQTSPLGRPTWGRCPELHPRYAGRLFPQ